jgi:uncharacterized repeat protein (TIGR01451 family)
VNTVSDSDSPADPTLSLREAIELSNGMLAVSSLSSTAQQQISGPLSVPNTIDFAIPGSGAETIQPTTDLPMITAPVIIDGTTQPGASANSNPLTEADNAVLLVVLDGSLDQPGNSGNGLTVSGGGSTVSGLVIDNFVHDGLVLTGSGSDVVAGDFIGTNPAGTAASPNGAFGVSIDSPSATIGGSDAAECNVISGNGTSHSGGGIDLDTTEPLGTGPASAVIQGNFLGTDATGTQALGRQFDGILMSATVTTTIGGTALGAGNVISGNSGNGIDADVGAGLIQGNLIGTDRTGMVAVPNGKNGILVAGENTTIGGTAAGAGNIISANGSNGIYLSDATGTLVQGNLIGTDATGTIDLGNSSAGILAGGTNSTTIGGSTAAAGNTIAFTKVQFGGDGQGVSEFGSGVLLLHNAIYGNQAAGIAAVGGIAPVLGSATASTIMGTLSGGAAGSMYHLEFFATPNAGGVADNAQGETFLAEQDVTTDGSGSVSFTVSPPGGVPAGQFITATATDPINNTSAFSNAVTAAVGTPVDLAVTAAVDSGPVAVGSALNYTFTVANQGTGMATGVVLSHMLPASVNFVTAKPSQGSYTENAGIVTASLGTILGGANATVQVDVIPQAIGSFTLQSQVIAVQGLVDPSQGSTSIPIDVSPSPPTNVTVTVASGTTPLNVTWSFTNPPGTTATFNVYRSETPGSEGTAPYATSITAQQFTDAGQVPGHIYYYQVTAVIGGLESLHSNEAAGTILTAPTNVTASIGAILDGETVANVIGNYPVMLDAGIKFNVYRATTPGGEGNKPFYTTPPFANDDLIVPGHVYYYEMSVSFAGVEGPRSAEVPLTFPAVTAPGSLMSTLALDGYTGESQLTLTWSDTYPVQPSGATFRVYEGATPGGEGVTPVQTVSIFDSYMQLLLPGSTQYFEVSSVINGVESPRSTEVQVTVPPLAAPMLTVLSAPHIEPDGTYNVVLEWTDPEPGVTSPSYYGYRGATPGGEGNVAFDYFNYIQPGDYTFGVHLAPGQDLFYEVSAVVGSYVGPRSNEVQITTPSLAAPQLSGSVAPTSNGRYAITFNWTDPDGGAAPKLLYNLYESETSGLEAPTQQIPLLPGPPVTFVVPPGTTVHAEVTAVADTYEGPRSLLVSITAPGVGLAALQNIHLQPFKARTTDVVLSFSSALDGTDAQNLAAYHLVTLGKLNKKTGQHATKPVKVTSAVYNPATDTVTLALKGKLPNQPLELSINTSAVLDASGQPIAGSSGQAGSTFQTTFGKKGITLPSISAS